jgi:hypothetical protein
MGNAAGQGADGFHLMGLEELGLHFSLVCYVLGNVDNAAAFTICIQNGGTCYMKNFPKAFMGNVCVMSSFFSYSRIYRTVGTHAVGLSKKLIAIFARQGSGLSLKCIIGRFVGLDDAHILILNGDDIAHGIERFFPLLFACPQNSVVFFFASQLPAQYSRAKIKKKYADKPYEGEN